MYEYYAAASPGTEGALCDELRELGFQSVRLNRGGIPFRGSRQDGWRACLESRIAQRIQLLLGRYQAPDEAALYDVVHSIDWTPYFGNSQTVSVRAVCQASPMTHSGFVALKVKDAIVDQLREKSGVRPNVDKEDPDVRIFVYVLKERVSIYLDLSGGALFQRGYRKNSVGAPLKETLAAAIVRMSGWDRETPLLDPMCGSGTIPIEAAQWATGIAPGLSTDTFGFERWADFSDEDAEEMRMLRGELRGRKSGKSPKITASDCAPEAVKAAQMNARAAGVRLAFRERSLFDLEPSDVRTHVIFNPPYGVRLQAEPEFVRNVATVISRMHGWRVSVLAGSDLYEKAIPANPVERFPLKNGALDCTLLVYEIE